jgi:CRISPR-associated endonuclease/helicase Cas3
VRSPHRGGFDNVATLRSKLDSHLAKFAASTGSVNEVRAQVLADCRAAGHSAEQGVFTLTAPTGCGKTLAGMAFALEHAVQHHLARVIVVLPYTSIIDQNAQVYRDVFGSANVIDHHASLDPSKETTKNRVACENWDAPIIVTTSVQFLESLLANKPSRCRKLHNVAKSVVIFDEVQTLPIAHLLPIVDVLKELARAYRTTLVLSTATQPALQHRKSGLSQVFPGFERTTEIVSDVAGVFDRLKRVRVAIPSDTTTPTSWTSLADDVRAESRVLVVTHQRRDARALAEKIPGSIHLSALMCPAHRLKTIQQIRQALGQPEGEVRVVSTQLVEAGVDFSFPVVYRALAGLDSIAQAAGRCNRNGELAGLGEVRVFVAESEPPPGTPRDALEVSRVMLAADPQLDALDPRQFEPFFRRLYFGRQLDEKGIQALRAGLRFKTVAEEFAIIDEDGATPVIVPYGDAERRLEDLRRYGPSRERLRALQPFTVLLYKPDFAKLKKAGAVELVQDIVHAIKCPGYRHLYDERFGLDLTKPIQPDPTTLFLS